MKYLIVILCVVWLTDLLPQTDSTRVAGFRASRILSSYPNNQFPSANYWVFAGNWMASKFNLASPASIWIVSLYISNGVTQLNFPSPGGSYPYINFITTDQNESYLTKFDQEGLKVWLQVEPGAANIDTLIYLVLNRYKHHPCVVGFGIDVEWYLTNQYPGGKKVTNEEAQRWEQKVKAINPTYTLFLKHYSQSWMPTNYRGQIFFVDDSQDFNFSSNPFQAMINEFKSWGQKFYPNKVGFQYGYKADSTWWKQLPDPAGTIGNALIANIPNCYGLFWVDFTINQVFPVSVVNENIPKDLSFQLYQNYPNPFNPSTKISFTIPAPLSLGVRQVSLKVYDILGNEVATLVDEYKEAGTYEIEFNPVETRRGVSLPSGIYFYQLFVSALQSKDRKTGNFIETRKMIFIR